MKAKARFVMATVVTGMLLAPLAFAEMTPNEVAEQCKKEAVDNEIPSGEVRLYVSECLAEHGIEAADAEKIVNEVMPSDDSGGSQSSGSDS